MHHKPEYPDFDLGSWRQVIWIADNGTDYLTEKIYVNALKNWKMPSVYDYQNASTTGIQEIVKLNSGVRAGKYDGKYQFSENLLELPVWGHASDINHIGSWAVFGSHEFFPAGPTSHDLNAAAGIIHVLLTNVHYNSKGFNIPQGEDWSKIYGPYLIYTSQEATGDGNWDDAKTRASQERSEWPYTWLTNTPEYPQAEGRGNIIGNFSISDAEKPELNGADSWIGVTELSAESNNDWQFESKNFQYWVKTDDNGDFDIKHIRPGTYSLFAIKNGVVDEFRMDHVSVTAGSTLNLGNLNWTIPRNNGNLVWEIGIPDRTAAEYKLGDFAYCEGFVQDQFATTFPNPIEYHVAEKNWSSVLPYVHSSYFKSDGNVEAWDWNINFDLTGAIPSTGHAKLTVAVASADHAQFWVYVNGTRITPMPYYPPVGGGNAFLRQSNHAKYGLIGLDVPYNMLRNGSNVIQLKMPSTSSPSVNHIMYDYISLEGDLSTTLGIQDLLSLDAKVKAFPNPTDGVFSIALPHTVGAITTALYSITGTQISSQQHLVEHNHIEFNISDKPDGIYFLKVFLKEPITLKIIKKR